MVQGLCSNGEPSLWPLRIPAVAETVNSNSACGLSAGIGVMSADADGSICCSPSQHV